MTAAAAPLPTAAQQLDIRIVLQFERHWQYRRYGHVKCDRHELAHLLGEEPIPGVPSCYLCVGHDPEAKEPMVVVSPPLYRPGCIGLNVLVATVPDLHLAADSQLPM